MKVILGDNQFFGVNHSNILKGATTESIFSRNDDIIIFIQNSMSIGLDGFMINSNLRGYDIVKKMSSQRLVSGKEFHYSIPYPHKYASIVNESGMPALLIITLRKLNLRHFIYAFRFITTFNVKHLIPILLKMEIPDELPKGSIVYLQNVVTDLLLGLSNGIELIDMYISSIICLGYKPGLITLNLEALWQSILVKHSKTEIYICFNVNYTGFNVFPSIKSVESAIINIKSQTDWKLVGMSIFSSGSNNIDYNQSIAYIKSLKLDYVVFGSSNLNNVKNNFSKLV